MPDTCSQENCRSDCCNSWGTCPDDYDKYFYDASFTTCDPYYDKSMPLNGLQILGLVLGLFFGIVIILFVIYCVRRGKKSREERYAISDDM